MKKKIFIDYYKKNKIIPTVNLSDTSLKKIFQQRNNFYNSVHIDINSFKNKKVLEFCPGTGYNAFFLLKNKVKKIKLVDNNPSSINQIKKNLSYYKKRVNLINKDIYEVKIKDQKFDFIIIENALCALEFPEKILKKLFPLLKKNGFFVFNYWDNFTLLNEKLRGLIAHLILTNHDSKNFSEQTKIISKFFYSHYEKLKNCGSNKKKINNLRLIEKWAQDTPMNYDNLILKKNFDLVKILDLAFSHNILLWKTSPDFNTDYIWYKNFDKRKFTLNSKINFAKNQINFIHHQEIFNHKKCKKEFRNISYNIRNIDLIMSKLKNNKKIKKIEFYKIIFNLRSLVKIFNLLKKNNLISKGLKEFVTFLKFYLKEPKKIYKYDKFKYFKSFWGNTVINISLKKY